MADCVGEVLITEPVTFTNGSYSCLILDKLRIQQDLGNFCDVVLHVEDHRYTAHRNVLAASSPYLESLLARNEPSSDQVVLNCGNHRIFEKVLSYMYSGKIAVDRDSVAEILRLANFLVISVLKDHCAEYLQQGLRTSNCFYIRDLADSNGLSALSKTIEAFIFANVLEIIGSHDVLDVSETKLDFLISRSMPLTEIERVKLICRWTEYRLEERKNRFPTLLSHVLWQRVGALELCHFLRDTVLLNETDFCMYHVLQSLKDCCLLPDIYFDSLNTLRIKFLSSDTFSDETGDPVGEITAQTSVAEEDDMEKCWDKASIDSDTTIAFEVSDHSPSSEKPVVDVILDKTPIEDDVDEKNDVKLPSVSPKVVLRSRNRKNLLQKPISDDEEPKLEKVTNKVCKSKRLRDENTPSAEDSYDKHAKTVNLSSLEKQSRLKLKDKLKSQAKQKPKQKRRPRGCPKFTCKLCPFSSLNPDKLKIHENAAHRDGSKFSCNLCVFSCNWNREYYQHMKTHYPGPPHLCDRCGFSADRVQVLLVHQMDHTDDRPYECKTCGVKFKMKSNLVAHSRCHSGEKPFECPLCDRSFATKGTMEQHMVTHSNQRPYLCDHCGFSTKYHSHLIAHKRLHTGDVFKCQFMNCDYSTPKRSQLACHMRCHMRIRSHTCTTCGKSFVEKSHLVRHERVHLEDKPFKCDLCDYSGTRRDKLKEHKAKYHDESSTASAAYRPRKSKPQGSGDSSKAKGKDPKAGKGTKTLQPKKPAKPVKIAKKVADLIEGTSAGTSGYGNVNGHGIAGRSSDNGVGILLETAIATEPQNIAAFSQGGLVQLPINTYATLGLVPLQTNGFATIQISALSPVQTNAMPHDLLNGHINLIANGQVVGNGNVLSDDLSDGNNSANGHLGFCSVVTNGHVNGHDDVSDRANGSSGSVIQTNGHASTINGGQVINLGQLNGTFSGGPSNGDMHVIRQIPVIELANVLPVNHANGHADIVSVGSDANNGHSSIVSRLVTTSSVASVGSVDVVSNGNGNLTLNGNGHLDAHTS